MQQFDLNPSLVAILVGSGFVTTVLWLNFKVRSQKNKAYLLKEVAVKSTKKTNIEASDTVVPAVAMFDVLYNLSKINPEALKGINHLHHSKNFSNLGELTNYMNKEILDNSSTADFARNVNKYKGYTGEQEHLKYLEEAGHDVELPASGNQPGHDLIVDGEKVNVKVTNSQSYIDEHQAKYPDIEVHTGSNINDAEALSFDHLNEETITNTTKASLEGIRDLDTIGAKLPLVTLALSGGENIQKLIKGETTVESAIENTAIDTGAVGVGASSGAKIGLAIGLSLAPVTGGISAMIVPAASTLIGSLIGVQGGKKIAKFFKERHLRSAQEELRLVSEVHSDGFLNGFKRITKALKLKEKQHRFHLVENRKQGLIGRLLNPSVQSTFVSMAVDWNRKEESGLRAYYGNLKSKVTKMNKGDEKSKAGLLIYSQGEQALIGDQQLLNQRARIEKKVKLVEVERKKVA